MAGNSAQNALIPAEQELILRILDAHGDHENPQQYLTTERIFHMIENMQEMPDRLFVRANEAMAPERRTRKEFLPADAIFELCRKRFAMQITVEGGGFRLKLSPMGKDWMAFRPAQKAQATNGQTAPIARPTSKAKKATQEAPDAQEASAQ